MPIIITILFFFFLKITIIDISNKFDLSFDIQVLSKWMIKHADVINTGNDIVDGVITVLLSTTILVGGVIGCLLDNIIPGKVDRIVIERYLMWEINLSYAYVVLIKN